MQYLAAHLKHETIETKLGLSNSTVRRAIRKLIKLRIIERIHYIRSVMIGLGANIYVILPVNDLELNRGKEADEPNKGTVFKSVSENELSIYKS